MLDIIELLKYIISHNNISVCNVVLNMHVISIISDKH